MVDHCWQDPDGEQIYTETTFPSVFFRQVRLNGSGDAKDHDEIAVELGNCINVSHGRPDDAGGRTFRDLHAGFQPACRGGSLNDRTVARDDGKDRKSPDSRKPPRDVPFACFDTFFATRTIGEAMKKTVTDTCPACREQQQADHFTTDGRCTSIVDWGTGGKTFKLPW